MRTLFKNGTIIDGTGEKPWVGDVLIEDDRIADVGENIAVKADKVVVQAFYRAGDHHPDHRQLQFLPLRYG